MQYTIRNILQVVEAALRRRAKRQSETLDKLAMPAIAEVLDVVPESPRRRSVRDILGARPKDAELVVELDAQRQIDPVLWR